MNRIIKDYKGNIYSSVQNMCNHYNLPTQTFYSRCRHGWSLQECLEGRKQKRAGEKKQKKGVVNHKGVLDHNGCWYPNQREMCCAFHVEYTTFRDRLRRGKTLKEALECETRNLKKNHIGERFMTACGVAGTITSADGHNFIFQFDDGNCVSRPYSSIIKGKIQHPKLNTTMKSEYYDCIVTPIFVGAAKRYKVNGTQLYRTECKLCGYTDVITPEEIREHSKAHAEMNNTYAM